MSPRGSKGEKRAGTLSLAPGTQACAPLMPSLRLPCRTSSSIPKKLAWTRPNSRYPPLLWARPCGVPSAPWRAGTCAEGTADPAPPPTEGRGGHVRGAEALQRHDERRAAARVRRKALPLRRRSARAPVRLPRAGLLLSPCRSRSFLPPLTVLSPLTASCSVGSSSSSLGHSICALGPASAQSPSLRLGQGQAGLCCVSWAPCCPESRDSCLAGGGRQGPLPTCPHRELALRAPALISSLTEFV